MLTYTHHKITIYGEKEDIESRWWEFPEHSIRVPEEELNEFLFGLSRHELMMIYRGHTADQINFLRHYERGYVEVTLLPIKDAPCEEDFEYFAQCENQPDYIPTWKDAPLEPRITENSRHIKYFLLWKIRRDRKRLYPRQLETERNIQEILLLHTAARLFHTAPQIPDSIQPTARAPGPSQGFG